MGAPSLEKFKLRLEGLWAPDRAIGVSAHCKELNQVICKNPWQLKQFYDLLDDWGSIAETLFTHCVLVKKCKISEGSWKLNPSLLNIHPEEMSLLPGRSALPCYQTCLIHSNPVPSSAGSKLYWGRRLCPCLSTYCWGCSKIVSLKDASTFSIFFFLMLTLAKRHYRCRKTHL